MKINQIYFSRNNVYFFSPKKSNVNIIKKIKNSRYFYFFWNFLKMILSKALNMFTNYLKKRGSSEKTQQKYYTRIEKIFIFSNKIWENRNNITIKEIEKYFKKQKWKHNTKCTEIAQLKSFLKFCNIQELCSLDSRKVFCPKREFVEANFLKPKEIKKILENISETNIRLKTAIYLLLTTGGRISEICSITKKQLENAVLTNGNFQITTIWKWKKVRPLFIPESIFTLCRKNGELHSEKTVIGWKTDKLQREIRKFRKKINLKFVAHTFRHTFITELAKSWTELYKIQKLAGHSNINTTATYLHSCNNELAAAVNNLFYR